MAKVAELGRVELDWLEPATPRRLREALRDGSYHVLHYVGHSDFTAEGDGVLYLEGHDSGHAAVDGDGAGATCWPTRHRCGSSCSTRARAPARR